jgi:endoglucanase
MKIRALAFSGLLLASCALAQTPVQTLNDFDAPFLFAYGSWDKKADVANGVARLSGFNNQGGAGNNIAFDLSGKENLSPALRVKVGPNNKAGALRVLLIDTEGKSATWTFSLKDVPFGETRLLTPFEGAPLSQPNEADKKGALNLAKIMQVQLQGDWAGGAALDVEVDAILLVQPSDAMLAQRQSAQQRLVREAEARRQERENQKNRYKPGTPLSPAVEHIQLVAPDVICLEVQAGRISPASLVKYAPQPGDEHVEKKNAQGEIEDVILKRGGKEIGWLIGPNREWLNTYEGYEGDPLLDFIADDAANYSVMGEDGFGTVKPTAVFRKSKPNGWAQGPGILTVRHFLYLKLPKSLSPGGTYVVSLGQLNTKTPIAPFSFEPAKVRSEAVKVNQIGYRPDDPVKRAFVSCWMGTGGALKLPPSLNFSLVDDKTGKIVFRGKGETHFPADKKELMFRDQNFNKTDVARLDFSGFATPGHYRVVVEGVGCSYPFEIGSNVWQRAFWTQMKGLYNQRSGMEIGPPYTDFKKPRDMHPADGYKVTKTKYRSVEKGNEAWHEIPAGDTGEAADGWGGYHDAGDWNPRRVSHMKVTMAQLEVLELFPDYFAKLKLNIPETKGVPDILTEAMWEFDCFLRMQRADGGVGYGLESKGDPRSGEVSWLNSFPSYALAPDYLNSWFFAAVGARLSYNLAKYDAKRAATYRQAAIRAFDWAEKDWAKDKAAGLTDKRGNTWEATDYRNLAALELYRLTRDAKYHELFLQDSVLKDPKPELFAWGKALQREHAFFYARLPKGLGDETLKQKAVSAMEIMAQRALTYANNNAFNLTTPDKGKPLAFGFYGTPDATDLTRAHFLTGKSEYLAGAVQATQFQGGCNPGNWVYITGLGANPLKNVFKLDSRRTGQPTPIGLVPYGNIDFERWNDNGITWPITWYLSKVTTPDPYVWPTTEAFWDLGAWPMLEEFTVDAWSNNVQVWGYLAARK